MKSLLTLLVLIHGYALADELNPKNYQTPMATLAAINNGTLLSPPAVDCNTYSEVVKKNNKELFNQCAVDLCGPPEKNISHYITDDKFFKSANLWSKLQTKFKEPLLNDLFQRAKKYKLAELDALKQYVKAPRFDNLSLETQVDFASDVFAPYIALSAKPSEAKFEERVEIKTNIPPNASAEMKEAINHYAANLKNSIDKQPLKFIPMKIYTEEELGIIVKQMLQNVKKTSDEYPEVLKKYPQMQTALFLIEGAFELKIPAMEHLVKDAIILTSINNTLANSTKKDSLAQAICNTSACSSVYKDYFDKKIDRALVEKNIALFEETLNSPATQTNGINKCKSNLIYKAQEYSNAKAASEVFLAAKNNIIKNVLPRFSAHSRKLMTDHLENKLKMNTMKPIQNESIDGFAYRAQMHLNSTKDVPSDHYELFKLTKRLNDSFENIDPLENMNPCEQNTPTVTDYYTSIDLIKARGNELEMGLLTKYKGNDQIFVSDFSCQNAAHGTHVMAHEISHAISSLMKFTKLSESSKALYDKVRSCTTTNYSKTNEPVIEHPLAHPGDTSHTEEDTADLLAALSAPNDKKINFCFFLEKSPMTNSYVDLGFIDPKSKHSTGLTRVLFEAINKDIPLPPSCEKLIREENPGMRFQKCEL